MSEEPSERWPLVSFATSPARRRRAGVSVSHHPPWSSPPLTHRLTARVGELIAGFQRWVIYTAAVPPVYPCPVFNSWQTHAFSVMDAFMASHIILLAQRQPHKDIKKFLWWIYLNQAGRLLQQCTCWHRYQGDNNDLESKLFRQLCCFQGQNFICCFIVVYIHQLWNFDFTWSRSSCEWRIWC